jgi:hypothetical protein
MAITYGGETEPDAAHEFFPLSRFYKRDPTQGMLNVLNRLVEVRSLTDVNKLFLPE